MVAWLSVALVFASFLGGLVAVLIGQFLSYYREQREEIEELYFQIKAVESLDSAKTPYSTEVEDVQELTESLRHLYLRNRWWMNDEVENLIGELIEALSTFEESKFVSEKVNGEHSSDYEDWRDEKEWQMAIQYADRAVDEIDADFERVPFYQFVPRYLGFIS